MNQRRHVSSSSSSSSRRISNIVSIRMYRILLRQLQALPAETPFLLQPALNPRDYGRAKLVNSLSLEEDDDILRLFSRWLTTIPAPNVSDDDNEDEVEVFQELAGKNAIVINDNDNNNSSKNKLWSLVDGGATDDVCAWTTREVIHRAVRTAFTSDIGRINVKQRHKYGFAASRFLQDLELMLERSSVSTQNGLRVVATSRYVRVRFGGVHAHFHSVIIVVFVHHGLTFPSHTSPLQLHRNHCYRECACHG